ncbi:MAG: DUF4783 domain-containing protein [Bacteroidia bacterium]
MKTLKTTLVALFIGTLTAIAGLDMLDDIANSLRSGDARSVTRYFGNTVDLTIGSQEEVYSKIQAEQVLRDFFSKNTPRSFTILHKGESKEGARYAIGTMVTAQGTKYRTYFYIKQQGSTAVIQELRFMVE